jgi:hypothetical protein
MGSRSERAQALRHFAGQIGAFQERTLIGIDRLRSALIDAAIDEEDRAMFGPEFEGASGVLAEAVGVTFEDQRRRLAALADALDALGMDHGPSRDDDAGGGARSGPAANETPEGARRAGNGYTGETILHRRDAFEVWSFAGIDPASIDWGADPDFAQKYGSERWKGRVADDYRALMAITPALLAQCRQSGTGDVAPDLALARDAYFGGDRIRLEVDANGRIGVVNGRHRLMAAIECGASIPVSVWRAK